MKIHRKPSLLLTTTISLQWHTPPILSSFSLLTTPLLLALDSHQAFWVPSGLLSLSHRTRRGRGPWTRSRESQKKRPTSTHVPRIPATVRWAPSSVVKMFSVRRLNHPRGTPERSVPSGTAEKKTVQTMMILYVHFFLPSIELILIVVLACRTTSSDIESQLARSFWSTQAFVGGHCRDIPQLARFLSGLCILCTPNSDGPLAHWEDFRYQAPLSLRKQ